MRKPFLLHPFLLVLLLFGSQVLLFILLLSIVSGSLNDNVVFPIIALCEFACVIYFFSWLWEISSFLIKRLNSKGVEYKTAYFKVCYFIFIACSIVQILVLGLPLIGSLLNDIPIVGVLWDCCDFLYGYARLIIPFAYIGSFFYVELYINSLEAGKKIKRIDVVSFILALSIPPLLIYLVQKDILKIYKRELVTTASE